MFSKFLLIIFIIYNAFEYSFALSYSNNNFQINSLDTLKHIVAGVSIALTASILAFCLCCCIKHRKNFSFSTRIQAPHGEHFQSQARNTNGRVNQSAEPVNRENNAVKLIEDSPPSYDELFTNEHK